jgi:hypothetical protein
MSADEATVSALSRQCAAFDLDCAHCLLVAINDIAGQEAGEQSEQDGDRREK